MSTTITSPEIGSAAVASKKHEWEARLSQIFWVNSVAISNDGKRVMAATFTHDYLQNKDNPQKKGRFLPNVESRFATYYFNAEAAKPAEPVWKDEYDGAEGIYGVAISGDGKVAASGGWMQRAGDIAWGLIRAYNVDDGKPLLDYTRIQQRVSWVALSEDGTALVASADDVYVFLRDRRGFNPVPFTLGVERQARRYVTGVAVHPSGEWVAACDQSGNVYMATIGEDGIRDRFMWKAPVEIPFLSVAFASERGTFVAGGGNSVFLFDAAAIVAAGKMEPSGSYDAKRDESLPDKPDGRPAENIRWVAISGNGEVVSAVANLKNSKGLLVALQPVRGGLSLLWEDTIDKNPNSTSIDAAGRYVTVSDGYPPGRPGNFRLYEAAGNPLWIYPTGNMNWPMVISADGSAIAAGGDDGFLYYFKP